MPVYEYRCDACGPFTQMRPMAEYEQPTPCPACGAAAPRVILTAPHCSTLSTQSRLAHATNERSAHAPRTLSSMKGTHAAGCTCCSGISSTENDCRRIIQFCKVLCYMELTIAQPSAEVL